MKRKEMLFITSSIMLLVTIIIFNSCKNESINSPKEDDFYSKELTFFNFDDAMNGIEDASFEKGMGFNSFFKNPEFPRGGFFERGHRGGKPDAKGGRLKEIFRVLQLSEDQRDELKDFMGTYKECMIPAIEQFRETASEYITTANAEREAILERVRSGEITREEARELLHTLNRETRELIKNDPDCIDAKEAMCTCQSELFESISSILNEDQIVIWNRWLENHREPCSG